MLDFCFKFALHFFPLQNKFAFLIYFFCIFFITLLTKINKALLIFFQSSDATTQRFLDEWRQFYPIHPKPGNCDADMPPVVEVLVGGVKMKYPTGYVLATDMDDPGNNVLLSPPCPLGKPAAKLSSGMCLVQIALIVQLLFGQVRPRHRVRRVRTNVKSRRTQPIHPNLKT